MGNAKYEFSSSEIYHRLKHDLKSWSKRVVDILGIEKTEKIDGEKGRYREGIKTDRS